MSNEDRILTPADVANMFRVDPKTVTRYAKDGKLPYFTTLGGHRRFYYADVVAAIAASTRRGGRP
jgi:excisionase family DNA binding protein